jgi:hypothetical protein
MHLLLLHLCAGAGHGRLLIAIDEVRQRVRVRRAQIDVVLNKEAKEKGGQGTDRKIC